MKNVKRLGLAVAIAATSVSVNASTLVFDFSGTATVTFDPAHHTPEVASILSAAVDSVPQWKTISGLIVLPSFENYTSGTHTIALNSNNLNLSLASGLIGNMEGSTVFGPLIPDSTQTGDAGFLTISNGMVMAFGWAAGPSNPIVTSFNAGLPANLPTRLGSVEVSLLGTSFSYGIGDVYFAANHSASAAITMVPEADSYAMLLAGLGIIGAIVRRRSVNK